jgi:hypothetical protein
LLFVACVTVVFGNNAVDSDFQKEKILLELTEAVSSDLHAKLSQAIFWSPPSGSKQGLLFSCFGWFETSPFCRVSAVIGAVYKGKIVHPAKTSIVQK